MLNILADTSTAFDYTAFSSEMTTGVGVVGSVATLIAGVLAGVLIWRKIAKYFNKAG